MYECMYDKFSFFRITPILLSCTDAAKKCVPNGIYAFGT